MQSPNEERAPGGDTARLPDTVLAKYASQIEYLHRFTQAGQAHFQSYRLANVLAIGSGNFLLSLASALLDSGLPKFHAAITDTVPTDRERLAYLVERGRITDPETAIVEIPFMKEKSGFWRDAIRTFDAILYVAQESEIDELRTLHALCREEKKIMLPALLMRNVGLAGPLVHPDSDGCWESAWRRLHRSVLGNNQLQMPNSPTSEAMLANLIVFELFKTLTGAAQSALSNKIFVLDSRNWEGDGHAFAPHPLVSGRAGADRVCDVSARLEQSDAIESSPWFEYFLGLTSETTGIFHVWGEGDLKQLPLSQCRIQSVDPLSEGPAELLPAFVCAGFTHEEARREAGLVGVESYVSRMARILVKSAVITHPDQIGGGIEGSEFIGVGAGESFAEGVSRGLDSYLTEELNKRLARQHPAIRHARLNAVEDERCRYYLKALTILQGEPAIGLGEEIDGFPVIWIATRESSYGCTGLNVTLALRKALVQALQHIRNDEAYSVALGVKQAFMPFAEPEPLHLDIPDGEATEITEILNEALLVLQRNHRRILIYELFLNPFLEREPVEVYGVLVQEEESS